MKGDSIAPIVVCSLILLSGLFTTQTNNLITDDNQVNEELVKAYTQHESIMITHDDNFTYYGFSGNGTVVDPYVIENYYISTIDEYGIGIEFTTKHFVIRNCYITADQTGINIEEVSVGTAIIVNNTCISNFFFGIRIYLCAGTIIENNTCLNSRDGIHIHSSPLVSLINNTCTENYYHGIKLEYSAQVSLVNNTCYRNSYCGIITWDCSLLTLENNTIQENKRWGLYLFISTSVTMTNNTLRNNEFMNRVDYCTGSTITGNRFYNDGLTIEDWNNTLYLTYTVEDNWVNDKMLGFFVNLNNFIFAEPIYGQFLLVNCTEIVISNQEIRNTDRAFFFIRCENITVKNNFCKNNLVGMRLYYSCNFLIFDNIFNNNTSHGIWLIESSDVTLKNNSCSNNKYYGIQLLGSHNNTLTENICNNNILGIWVDCSDSCRLSYNVIKENEEHGIYVSSFSDNNIIHHNSFINNNPEGISQAKDDGNNNTWWDIKTQEGNFWSEWKSKPYTIEGRANATDPYPLDVKMKRIIFELGLFIPALLLAAIMHKRKRKRK
ncbi:MAG: right-handed parallel beta-helix repeat-containing protein [Candidatus Heimdallarchaeota archaeon]|nr:right-handed parallel beta-helix repeat-containing protein [Candidatus Heimdallarchaeota archaeon]MCK4955929.1 right-handed parallel beta-helix repeat-containing protein [Candidatus Heimdallarchaeota archaeon]